MQIDPPASSYKALQDPLTQRLQTPPSQPSSPVSLLVPISALALRFCCLLELFFGTMNAMRSCFVPVIAGFMFLTLLQLGYGQSVAPSPAPEAPSNDGKAIDQGIAYILLLVALAITYLLH